MKRDWRTEISSHYDILLLDGVAAAVLSAEEKGTVVKATDRAHWNEVGHGIAGRAITDTLKKTILEENDAAAF